ncbi:MAG: hypothetical protein AAB401_02485, partial [Acidobacteriota bacterium]
GLPAIIHSSLQPLTASNLLRHYRSDSYTGRALEDSNQEVRWLAVIGLSKIAGEKWIGIETFQDSEQKTLGHWREWAKNYR